MGGDWGRIFSQIFCEIRGLQEGFEGERVGDGGPCGGERL
jgi:hypothetical protein